MKGSWKHEFDVKYRRATSGGDTKMIDNANIILTKALENLEDMLKCEKDGRIWNPKTNKCGKFRDYGPKSIAKRWQADLEKLK